MKPIRADEVHANQVIEFLGKRCRVLRVFYEPDGIRLGHRRQRGSHRSAVVLRVMPMGPWEKRQDLHFFCDEPVTIIGWSFGQHEPDGSWS